MTTPYDELRDLCAIGASASGSSPARQDAPVGRTLYPAIPIHDPRFKWVSSANTDIRKRFDAIRRAQRGATVPPKGRS